MTQSRTPLDVILSVEDWIDYPPHTIGQGHGRKIIQALDAAGYVIVPKEPTEAMLAAPHFKDWAWRAEEPVEPEQIAQAWREMVAAASADPPAPTPQAKEGR